MSSTTVKIIKSLISEQMGTYTKKQGLKIDIGGEKHDPTSPNKSHIEEEELDEVIGTATAIGANRRRKKRTSFAYTSLGGSAYAARASGHRQGNQKGAGRYTMEEATRKVIKKMNEKKSEVPLGSTSTKKRGETIDVEPNQPELTGYH